MSFPINEPLWLHLAVQLQMGDYEPWEMSALLFPIEDTNGKEGCLAGKVCLPYKGSKV